MSNISDWIGIIGLIFFATVQLLLLVWIFVPYKERIDEDNSKFIKERLKKYKEIKNEYSN